MVLSRKKNELTKENILKHISEADIIQGFWPAGKELVFNTGIISPFRTEDDPSFIIGNKFGPITYKDLGQLEYRGDVWKFVQQIEGLKDFVQVLKAIDKRFQLGYSDGNVIKGRSEVITWKEPEMKVPKIPVIQVSTRKFNKDELAYWNMYHQDISDLRREEIYAPATIWRNRRMIPIKHMTFCYFLPEIGRWKIYRPLAPKKGKKTPPCDWKWDNSMDNLQYIEGLANMKGDIGIVEKSRKDAMMLKKALGITSICTIQAEDPSAMNDTDLKFIADNCKKRIICADNDKKGKAFSWWLTKQHGYKHCNVPDALLSEGISDFADMGRYYGIEAVQEHFKLKGVLI